MKLAELSGEAQRRLVLRPALAVALELALGIALSATLLWAFAEFSEEVIEGESRRFDRAVLLWVEAHSPAWLDEPLRLVTSLGYFRVVLPLSALAALLFYRARAPGARSTRASGLSRRTSWQTGRSRRSRMTARLCSVDGCDRPVLYSGRTDARLLVSRLARMLDTNTCIYVIRQRSGAALRRFEEFEVGEVGLSVVTVCELHYGVEKSARPEQNALALEQFLLPLEILDFDAEAARHYGRLRASLEKKGTPIGPLDTLIAAHALGCGATLVTNNVRQFERVEGLRVEDWTSS